MSKPTYEQLDDLAHFVNVMLHGIGKVIRLTPAQAESLLRNIRTALNLAGYTIGANGVAQRPMEDPPGLTVNDKLKLYWPTDYETEKTYPAHPFTQRFGSRPEYYGKFKLPGHDGLDFRAPDGSNIYACANGVVTQVGWRKPGHAYGYAVRILHRVGVSDEQYETIYAHLQEGSSKVKVGDIVFARQVIGLADSTGNSSASHLHLSLKKVGATARGETNYPYDLVDPTPFIVSLRETNAAFLVMKRFPEWKP